MWLDDLIELVIGLLIFVIGTISVISYFIAAYQMFAYLMR